MIHGRARGVALAAPALTGAGPLGVGGGNGSAVTATFRTPAVTAGRTATGSTATPGTTPAAGGPTTGNGTRVQTLDQVRKRATAFADRLALRVAEAMRFSRNFHAELQSGYRAAAGEILLPPTEPYRSSTGRR